MSATEMSRDQPGVGCGPPADLPAAARTIGLAAIARVAFERGDPRPVTDRVLARLKEDPGDPGALMDLATILQSRGAAEEAGQIQREAVALRRTFATVHGDGSGPRLLAFVTAGDFMANTPVDFLLEGSNAVLWQVYLDAADRALPELPAHDVAMLAVAEAECHSGLLARFAELSPACPAPILNGEPDRIAALTRDGVAERLADVKGVFCPPTLRMGRSELQRIAEGKALAGRGSGLAWPLVLRPVGGHAGGGLRKADGPAELAEALAQVAGSAFFVAPFVDYRDASGLFAKGRVVLIGGRAYPVHLALSEDWMVHYLSAGMAESADKRAAEAKWFEEFDDGFARRHAEALAAMQARIGLDYWGIDCAELPDGRLLVFEADTAMIVHDMDDRVVFPYKQAPMARLFAAFRGHAEAAAGRITEARSGPANNNKLASPEVGQERTE